MRIKVNPRLITDTLSHGMVSKLKTVIAEYVANAWDADATEVNITIPDPLSNDPILIQDNGEGIDVDQFSEISRNRQENNKKWTRNNRPVIGSKGVGRWSGFAFAYFIEYETVRDGKGHSFSFRKGDLEKLATLQEYDFDVREIVPDFKVGTRVKLWLNQDKPIPEPADIIKELSLEFAVSSDFVIKVNGQILKEDDLPGKKIEIHEKSDIFGEVTGYINITNAPYAQRKRQPGLIIRVHRRRVVGPDFFGMDKQLSKKILGRIRGEITANSLEDVVASNREAFIEHEEKYLELKNWLREKLLEVASTIQDEENIDIAKKLFEIQEVNKGFKALPAYKQREFIRQVREMEPRLKRASKDKDMLGLFGQLLLRALDNNDFQTVLSRLQETESEDVSLLSKVLQEWGFGEVARASNIIQERLKALHKFSELIRDDATLELQHIHRVLENNTWLLDERYDLYFSNKSLRKIAKEIGGTVDEKHERQRPDLILKENSSREFLIVELKRPSKTIDMVDVSQILGYKTLLKGLFPNMGDLDLYLIGRQFDPTVLDNYPINNTQRLRLLSLDEVVQAAHHRLNWLAKQISEQLEEDSDQADYAG